MDVELLYIFNLFSFVGVIGILFYIILERAKDTDKEEKYDRQSDKLDRLEEYVYELEERLQGDRSSVSAEELKAKNALANVLPLLLETQDSFLNLISLSKKEPFQIFDLIDAAKFPANLFLKHLVVLTDYGGEPIQRLGRSFKDIFPKDSDDNYYFDFVWKGDNFRYQFEAFPIRGINNKKFGIQIYIR